MTKIKRVVIWGHSPEFPRHTHSYIHEAYYRAFGYLGYDTYWVWNPEDTRDVPQEHTLFFTDGLSVGDLPGLPTHPTNLYVLHNVAKHEVREMAGFINLQVYVHNAETRPDTKKLAEKTFFRPPGRYLCMPWATDLLPYECAAFRYKALPAPPKMRAVFVGSVTPGAVKDNIFSNYDELEAFKRACHVFGLDFMTRSQISNIDNIELVRSSLLAPSLQGTWQVEQGYIPCRIFKNTSYGAVPLTNNPDVQDLIPMAIYSSNMEELCEKGIAARAEWTQEKMNEAISLIEESHTFANRIQTIMDCFRELGDIE